MKKRNSTIGGVILAALILAWAAPALANGPMSTLKRTHADIDKLLAKKAAKGSPQEAVLDDKIKARVNAFLDYQELARRSLSKHWGNRTPDEQQEFVRLLKGLIERNYVKQLRKAHGQELAYSGEKINGDKGQVTTTVEVKKKRGRKATVEITYKMKKVGADWMVYDVVTDDVSIVRNYRAQFNKIIKKKSYEHLVKKMRKKVAKLEAKNS